MPQAIVNPMSLQDKQILITGASSGIGRETAVLCCNLGAKVIGVARREEKLQELKEELGDSFVYYTQDISDIEALELFIQEVVQKNGALDGFVHSAGVPNIRPLSSIKPEILHDSMKVCFYAFVEIVRQITKKRCFNTGLSIVGISSISSFIGNQAKTSYCASKAAMDAAIRCMAKELAPKGIRANSVAPSFVRTQLLDAFQDYSKDSEDAKEMISRQYLGIGDTIDVANMVAFLLSSASKFITGSTIAVDGGKLSS